MRCCNNIIMTCILLLTIRRSAVVKVAISSIVAIRESEMRSSALYHLSYHLITYNHQFNAIRTCKDTSNTLRLNPLFSTASMTDMYELNDFIEWYLEMLKCGVFEQGLIV